MLLWLLISPHMWTIETLISWFPIGYVHTANDIERRGGQGTKCTFHSTSGILLEGVKTLNMLSWHLKQKWGWMSDK